MRSLVFDPERCVGCKVCQLVCSGTWQRVFNPLKANVRVEQTEWYGPFQMSVCRQESDAPCVAACPTGALYRDEQKRIIRCNRRKCDGCGLCVPACPHDAIFVYPDVKHVFKCDLCGGGTVQHCVEACPRNALRVEEGMP